MGRHHQTDSKFPSNPKYMGKVNNIMRTHNLDIGRNSLPQIKWVLKLRG